MFCPAPQRFQALAAYIPGFQAVTPDLLAFPGGSSPGTAERSAARIASQAEYVVVMIIYM